MRSLVPFDMPGQRNNSPFCVDGAVPGMIVVTELMMCDIVGPKDTMPPHESRLMDVVGEGRAEAEEKTCKQRRGSDRIHFSEDF